MTGNIQGRLTHILFAIGLFTMIAGMTGTARASETQTVGANGYDLVAYQTESKAVRGDTQITSHLNGTIYLFASKDNKKAFDADPAKYLPAYGGYCAFGVAMGFKFPVDPEAFSVVDGNLYLNLNKKVQSRWMKDVPGLVAKADDNWPKIREIPADKL